MYNEKKRRRKKRLLFKKAQQQKKEKFFHFIYLGNFFILDFRESYITKARYI